MGEEGESQINETRTDDLHLQVLYTPRTLRTFANRTLDMEFLERMGGAVTKHRVVLQVVVKCVVVGDTTLSIDWMTSNVTVSLFGAVM